MTIDQTKQAIGSNLQTARRKVRLTQQEVADLVEIDVNYYARIEQGRAVPSLVTLKAILGVLKVRSSKILPF